MSQSEFKIGGFMSVRASQGRCVQRSVGHAGGMWLGWLLTATAVAVIAAAVLFATGRLEIPFVSGPGLLWHTSETALPNDHQYSHGPRDGLALTADGRKVALASRCGRVNEIELIDVQARSGVLIAASDPTMALLDPSFAPDGETLAVVAAERSRSGEYTGVSRILIVDLTTGRYRDISEPDRYYRMPAFSPDGRRLAFFRDVSPRGFAADTGVAPLDVPLHPVSLFEADLATGTVTPLSERAFSGAVSLFYDQAGQDLFFSAGDPFEPFIQEQTGKTLWRPGTVSEGLRYDQEIRYANVMRLRRGQDLGRWPSPAVPNIPELAGGLLAGISAEGGLTLLNSSTDADGMVISTYAVEYRDGQATIRLKSTDSFLQQIAVAQATGQIVADEGGALTSGGSGGVVCALRLQTNGNVIRLTRRDINFRTQPILLSDPTVKRTE